MTNYLEPFRVELHRMDYRIIDGIQHWHRKEHLRDFHLDQFRHLGDLVDQTAEQYGGGRYKLLYQDARNKRIKSQIFETCGKPKPYPCNCKQQQLLRRGCKNPLHI